MTANNNQSLSKPSPNKLAFIRNVVWELDAAKIYTYMYIHGFDNKIELVACT